MPMQEYMKLDQPEILSHLFHPRREPKTRLPVSAVDMEFEVDSGIFLGCRFHIHDAAAPSIIYFHGNGEVVCDYDDIGLEYTNVGCNFLVMSYRGYGWSSGIPTVQSMFNDGRQLFSEVVAWLRGKGYTGPLFMMGRSLGSACAIDLALIHGENLKGLIIESGFADTLPLLEVLGISLKTTNLREEECFANSAKIARIKIPTLILHGARDQLIPSSEAEKLQSNSGARNKQFFLIPGADHNTMIATAGKLYFQMIRQFIDTITGASSWRNKRKMRKTGTQDQL
jgi:uncharacterized protein